MKKLPKIVPPAPQAVKPMTAEEWAIVRGIIAGIEAVRGTLHNFASEKIAVRLGVHASRLGNIDITKGTIEIMPTKGEPETPAVPPEEKKS